MKTFRTCCLGTLIAICTLVIGVLVLMLAVGRLMNPNSPPRQAAMRMEEYFQRDHASFLIVRDYLIDVKDEHNPDFIRIWRPTLSEQFDNTMSLGHGHLIIEDEAVLQAIHHFFANRYSGIMVSNNTIRFQRWSTLDNGWGALYVIDRTIPHSESPERITILEPLSTESWYFYQSG